MQHAGFIAAAYAVAAAIVSAMTLWVIADYSALRRRLSDYEKRGLGRGSGIDRA